MKLLSHFPNFDGATNGYVISCHILLGMWLRIHGGIKVNVSEKDPMCESVTRVKQIVGFNLKKVHVQPLKWKACWCQCMLLTGWPRSGWSQVGHFDQKIKVNQIASYCAMLYPRCCSLWPCTFWGLHSSTFDSSAGQTRGSHFNFYWGTDTTMWSYVHFLCSCVTKIDFYHLLWNSQVKRLIKQHKTEIRMCLFVFENQFEHVIGITKLRLAQIRVATFLHIMLQICHRGK